MKFSITSTVLALLTTVVASHRDVVLASDTTDMDSSCSDEKSRLSECLERTSSYSLQAIECFFNASAEVVTYLSNGGSCEDFEYQHSQQCEQLKDCHDEYGPKLKACIEFELDLESCFAKDYYCRRSDLCLAAVLDDDMVESFE